MKHKNNKNDPESTPSASVAQPRLKLPIGIQNFKEIREEGYCYVDKTPHILSLVQTGKYYFLSRPRRFGKSLLVDTIRELFEGNEALFRGLYVHDRWDWHQAYPVLQISLGQGSAENRDILKLRLSEMLEWHGCIAFS